MKTALYRKYRPAHFFDVVGQDAVVAALKNQVKTGRIGHSYLFTGIRGTGKTSFAKILAKAVNCLHPDGGEPCGTCAVCVGIDNGSLLDVTEIDAASNSGVDNVRALREETAYAPAVCRMRVYIIDEVHMLTREAFNALLKIMEEPPAHVLFILATTEVHKVPATILSRCQRFDLKRIAAGDIQQRLLSIAKKEEIALTEDGAALLARLADGALRDALSLLDTCSSLGGVVDEATVAQLAGVADKNYLFALADAIAREDLAALFEQLSALYAQSVDPTRLCLELVRHYRNLVLCKVSGTLALNDCAADDVRRYQEQAARSELPFLLATLSRFADTADQLSNAPDRMLLLELCFVKLCAKGTASIQPTVVSDDVPWQRQTPKPQPQRPVTQPVPPSAVAEPESKKKEIPVAAQGSTPEPIRESEPQETDSLFDPDTGEQRFAQWPAVVDSLKATNGMLYGFLANSKAYLTQTHVLIAANEFFLKHIRENASSKEAIKQAIVQVTGITLPIGPYVAKAADVSPAADALDDIDDLIARAQRGGVDVEIR